MRSALSQEGSADVVPGRARTVGRMSRLVWAMAAVALYVLLAAPLLERQGLYYDELHQATASFAYRGVPAPMFNGVDVLGLPALNMPYQGAIKTGIYGLYLRLSGADFSVLSWRWLGIVFTSVGLAAFVWLALPYLSGFATAVVVVLVVTDLNVLVSTRHDWGPVALSLALRLVILGLFVRHASGQLSHRHACWIGLLTGLVVFEKLSGIVIFVPVAAMLLMARSGAEGRRVRGWFVVGLLVGLAPLLYLNTRSWFQYGTLISLAGTPPAATHSWTAFTQFVPEYLTLGAGVNALTLVFGSAPRLGGWPEAAALLLLLACGAHLAWRLRGPAGRFWIESVGAWSLAALLLFWLPAATNSHHWVLGTPFQYVATAMLLSGKTRGDRGRQSASARVLVLATVVLLVVRLPGLGEYLTHVRYGHASANFSPALTRLGEFARQQGEDVLFVATDWGVGTQIVCFSNGSLDKLEEAFWSYRDATGGVQSLLEHYQDKRLFILVSPEVRSQADQTSRIVQDFLSEEGLQHTRTPETLSSLDGLRLESFVRRDR